MLFLFAQLYISSRVLNTKYNSILKLIAPGIAVGGIVFSAVFGFSKIANAIKLSTPIAFFSILLVSAISLLGGLLLFSLEFREAIIRYARGKIRRAGA